MNKKKSVSIILIIMLTILIGITGCGTKNIQNAEGTAQKLSGIISQHIQLLHFHNSAFSGVSYKATYAVQSSYII